MPIIAIAIGSTFIGCVDSEKDLYNPSYKTGNPMGDGFAAPDGFDWSTTTTKTVSVEVKDEFDGQYYYTIDIYNENPLYSESAKMLASGVAKKGSNYVVALDLLKSQEGIYVKQTDPKGRVGVYMYDVPEDNEKITCKLYYSNTQSRALATRGAVTRATSFEKPDYTSIPDEAIEVSEVANNLLPNTSYKITKDYNGTFKFWGNKGNEITKVFVAANWTIPSKFTFQNGIEIIVMDNGKIESSNSLEFVNNSVLTIMDNGSVNANILNFTNGGLATLRNWGNLTVKTNVHLSSGATYYNKGTFTSNYFRLNSNSTLINDNKIIVNEKFDLPSNYTLENNGEIRGKNMETNGPNGTFTNNNIVVFTDIKFNINAITNNCHLEATNTLKIGECTMNNNQGYVKASIIEILKGETYLNNGSMMEATDKILSNQAPIYGKGENTSLIKSPVVTQGFYNYMLFDGNLAIETNDIDIKHNLENGAYISKMGESKVFIEVCTGIKNEGNDGDDPKDPNFPIITTDTQKYTYMFEDQWPLYGDYDMNDIVLIINEKKIYANKDNKVERVDFSIDLSAVGATKGIGAAIMLDGVPASSITQPIEFSDNSLVKNFNTNSNGIENGQDYAVIPLFDNAHSVLGSNSQYQQINTFADHANNTNPQNISFSVKFNNPTLEADAFNVTKLNVFIIVDGNRNNRKEIHVVNYPPTNLANTELFGGNNDGSSIGSKKYYISKENLAWGIVVPADFRWPLEYVNIKNAYSQFERWVTTGGEDNKEWWNNADSSKIF